MTRQSEAVGITKTLVWWQSVIKRIKSITREEMSSEPTDQFISDTMKELIDEILPLIPEDDNQITTSITFRHVSGKNITFAFSAEITEGK